MSSHAIGAADSDTQPHCRGLDLLVAAVDASQDDPQSDSEQDDADSVISGSHQKRKLSSDGDGSSRDASYWEKRRKNNEAARRSREKRRMYDVAMEAKILELSKENSKLKQELDVIRQPMPCEKVRNAPAVVNHQFPSVCKSEMESDVPSPVHQRSTVPCSAPTHVVKPIPQMPTQDHDACLGRPTSSLAASMPNLSASLMAGVQQSVLNSMLQLQQQGGVPGSAAAASQFAAAAAANLPAQWLAMPTPSMPAEFSGQKLPLLSPHMLSAMFAPTPLPLQLQHSFLNSNGAHHPILGSGLSPFVPVKKEHLSPPLLAAATAMTKRQSPDTTTVLPDSEDKKSAKNQRNTSARSVSNSKQHLRNKLLEKQNKRVESTASSPAVNLSAVQHPLTTNTSSLSVKTEADSSLKHCLSSLSIALNGGSSANGRTLSPIDDPFSPGSYEHSVGSGSAEDDDSVDHAISGSDPQRNRYVERRRRNNEAAKRCRANRRALFEFRSQRSQELEAENLALKREMMKLTDELTLLRETIAKRGLCAVRNMDESSPSGLSSSPGSNSPGSLPLDAADRPASGHHDGLPGNPGQ